jgi:hypothetical protein
MRTFKKLGVALVAAFCFVGLTPQLSALDLVVGDAQYVGAIVDGVPPGGGDPSNEFNWLNELIDVAAGDSAASTNPAGETLDRTDSTLAGPLPSPFAEFKSDPPQGTYIVAANSLYLLGKYGAGASGEQVSHVWYLGNLAVGTSVSLPLDALSHDTLFVPDGGLTLMLLGLGLAGIGATKRFAHR